ncbi:hypothetical protein EGW08_019423 [Elysia chlorotica]|uniref:DUF1308 domain-containing protein n=1 Tax=Elysia chlorotica TaxID=188477 RepID=A0A433SU59_ELYCH|nr:hypothetical protein EGW08_019423 [Elysia chlorotica]
MDFKDNKDCWPDVNDFIEFAESLKQRVSKLGNIQGVGKLERKIRAELKFMNQLKQRDLHTQQSRLKSSNLGHFASLVHASERLPRVAGVLVPYQLPSRPDSLLVDLLALGGHAWVKVVARKAQALHLVWAGAGQFGERDLLSQASEYLECAARHPINFCTPQIHFAFYNQVTDAMATALERLGVKVWGERVPVDPAVTEKLHGFESEENSSQSSDCEDDLDTDSWNDETLVISPPDFQYFSLGSFKEYGQNPSPPVSLSSSFTEANVITSTTASPPLLPTRSVEGVCGIQRVNLDITSLIALVSSVTHGRCQLVFRDQVLTAQAQEERHAPVLPVLNRFLAGKQMFACETAVSSFRSILNILGGAEEKERATEFLSRVKVVPDQPSARALELKCQGRVKERSKVVFGTGDTLHAITITSNMGFVRAAQSQGVVFPVFLHPARALTEEKESSAQPL